MRKLIIHMGAHRCGSTAVQSMLRREQTELLAHDIKVLLRADMVAGGVDLRRLHRYHSVNPIWQKKLKDTVFAVDNIENDTMLVSEENLMGTMPAVRSKGFYPHFGRLVRGMERLGAMLPDQVSIEPRLVVRRQDRYLESVYAFRVSRGLAQGFDRFLKNVTKSSISWCRLAQQLEKLQPAISPKIALLEAWPKPTAADQALRFLVGPNECRLSSGRLTGNTRHSHATLRLMLALNKAKIQWRTAPWKQDVLELADIYRDEPEADMVYVLKDRVSKRDYSRFERAYNPSAKLGFEDAQREFFLSDLSADNEDFLKREIVISPADAWAF